MLASMSSSRLSSSSLIKSSNDRSSEIQLKSYVCAFINHKIQTGITNVSSLELYHLNRNGYVNVNVNVRAISSEHSLC